MLDSKTLALQVLLCCFPLQDPPFQQNGGKALLFLKFLSRGKLPQRIQSQSRSIGERMWSHPGGVALFGVDTVLRAFEQVTHIPASLGREQGKTLKQGHCGSTVCRVLRLIQPPTRLVENDIERGYDLALWRSTSGLPRGIDEHI